MKKKLSFALAIATSILTPLQGLSAPHAIEPSLGIGILSHSDYDEGAAMTMAYTFSANSLLLSTGTYYASQLHHKSDKKNTKAEIVGQYAAIGYAFKLPAIQIHLKTGLAYSESRVWLLNHKVGKDSSWGGMASTELVKPLSNHVAIRGGLLYLNNVSNEQIYIINAGVKISF